MSHGDVVIRAGRISTNTVAAEKITAVSGKSHGRRRLDGTAAAIAAIANGNKIIANAIPYSFRETSLRVSIEENAWLI